MTPIWTPAPIALGDANVFSASEIEAYEREILANPSATEHDASRFFHRLPKFLHLGAGAEIRREVVLIGANQRVDFFRRSYGERFWDIIELKSPHKPLVAGGTTVHPRLSSDVERAISQALDYSDLIGRDGRLRTDLADKGISVCRPQIIVVVGQDRGEVDSETLRILYDRVRSRGALDPRSYTDIYAFAKEHYARTKMILLPAFHFAGRTHFSFQDLHLRHPGISRGISALFDEATRVCLDRHHVAPVEFVIERGEAQLPVVAQWTPADERTRRACENRSYATELGACGLVLAAIEASDGLVALGRAQMVSGVDFMLGKAGDTLQDIEGMTRLEISGVDQGGMAALRSRLQHKILQAARGAHNVPAIAGVVGFAAQRIVVKDVPIE